MNLQEQISRIKSMMGVINETILPTRIKRRMNELPKFITSTYKWLDPKAFDSLDEFIDRVVFSVTRDFSSEYSSIQDYDKLLKVRDEMESYIRQNIMDNFYDEIKDYYIKK